MTAGYGSILLTRPGGFGPVRIPAADVSAGWAINAIPPFSCRVAAGDVFAAGFADRDLCFLWIEWEHPTAGTWYGQVVTEPWGDRELEIVAEGWASLLRRARTARSAKPQTMPPGAHFARLARDLSGPDGQSWLRPAQTDGDGAAITVTWQAEDAWDVTQRLIEESRMQFRVLDDRTPEFMIRVGRDLTSSVVLADGPGGCLGNPQWVRDCWTIENDILGVGGDGNFATSAAFAVADKESIQHYGRRQGTRIYPGLNHAGAIETAVRAELAQTKDPASTLTVDCADVGGIWATFREGDTVLLCLSSASLLATAQVMARTWEGGIMSLALEIREELSRAA